MEFICPACGKFAEVREQQIFQGSRFRCSDCWSALQVESTRPLRVQVEARSDQSSVHVGVRDERPGGKE